MLFRGTVNEAATVTVQGKPTQVAPDNRFEGPAQTTSGTNTVMVTPYRGAGRPQGCYAMERTMDAIAAFLGKDRADVRAVNFIQPDEFPYDQGLIFQDGRELEYDSGDYPASLERL